MSKKYFVTDPPVAVPDPEGTANIIWIRPKMDVETRGKVRSELAALGEDGKTAIMQAGAQQVALLLYNIVRWEGPDLDGMPCTPANIRRFDPTEPHIEAVLNEIGERNKPRASPDPKSAAASGSVSAGIAGSRPSATPDATRSPSPSAGHPLATTISRSPLPSVSDGRPSRSAD